MKIPALHINLHFGRKLGSSIDNTASQAPTQGSGTSPTNPLDPISEETSKSHSDTSSIATRDRESSETWSQDHETMMRQGKFSESSFENPAQRLNFNVQL